LGKPGPGGPTNPAVPNFSVSLCIKLLLAFVPKEIPAKLTSEKSPASFTAVTKAFPEDVPEFANSATNNSAACAQRFSISV
jgi:hypothetical protein